jgi:hypothetical protein
MQGCGADTSSIDRLLTSLRNGDYLSDALHQADVPPSVCQFVTHTFKLLDSRSLPAIAAAFTFGREDCRRAQYRNEWWPGPVSVLPGPAH